MWYYKGFEITLLSQIPEEAFGFTYCITNLSSGKKYIGKKQLIFSRRTKISKKEQIETNNKRKKYKIVSKESDWLSYCGSNINLLEDIKKGDKIHKEILEFYYSNRALTYAETKLLFVLGCIETDEYYNNNILSKFYSGKIT